MFGPRLTKGPHTPDTHIFTPTDMFTATVPSHAPEGADVERLYLNR